MITSFFKKNKNNLLAFLLITFLVFIFFYPTLHLGFFSDDYHFLYVTATQDSVLKYLFLNIIGESGGGSYGPMLNFIFTAEYNLFHLHAFFYHMTVLLVYALTAFVLFLFTRNISKNNLVAWGSAIFFIFLQNHTSTVSWVAVQPHLWATFFFVLFLYFYQRFIVEKNNWYYIFSLLFIIFSLFTKESAITFPAIFILLELFFGENKSIASTLWRIVRRGIAFALALLSYLVIRFVVLGYVFGYYGSEHLSSQVLPKLKMFVELVLSMFLASPLRQHFRDILFFHPYFLTLIFLLVLAVTWFVSRKNKTKILWFSLLSFCLATVPFLNVRFENSSDEGERYGFLVSVFFVIFLAQFLYSIFGNLKYKKYFYFGLITLFVVFSFFIHFEKGKLWQKSADLRDSMLTQFANNLDKSKNNYFIFLSFPDNFSGTQLTRNAVLEMFKLENNFFSMSGERVTMYSLLNEKNYQEKIVNFSRDLDTVRLQPVRENIGKVLSGTGQYHSEYFDAIFDSKNIEVSLKRVQIDKSPYDMTLVYFDGQRLNFVPLN